MTQNLTWGQLQTFGYYQNGDTSIVRLFMTIEAQVAIVISTCEVEGRLVVAAERPTPTRFVPCLTPNLRSLRIDATYTEHAHAIRCSKAGLRGEKKIQSHGNTSIGSRLRGRMEHSPGHVGILTANRSDDSKILPLLTLICRHSTSVKEYGVESAWYTGCMWVSDSRVSLRLDLTAEK